MALSDLATAFKSDDDVPYRVIGGQMVMVLAGRWRLGADPYRVTLDADLGTPPVVVRDHTLVKRLAELGYKQVSVDQFTKPVAGMPAGNETDTREAVIHILLPAYTTRPSQNKRAGDVVATEALGLAAALAGSTAIHRVGVAPSQRRCAGRRPFRSRWSRASFGPLLTSN